VPETNTLRKPDTLASPKQRYFVKIARCGGGIRISAVHFSETCQYLTNFRNKHSGVTEVSAELVRELRLGVCMHCSGTMRHPGRAPAFQAIQIKHPFVLPSATLIGHVAEEVELPVVAPETPSALPPATSANAAQAPEVFVEQERRFGSALDERISVTGTCNNKGDPVTMVVWGKKYGDNFVIHESLCPKTYPPFTIRHMPTNLVLAFAKRVHVAGELISELSKQPITWGTTSKIAILQQSSRILHRLVEDEEFRDKIILPS